MKWKLHYAYDWVLIWWFGLLRGWLAGACMQRRNLGWRCCEAPCFLKSLSTHVLVFSKETNGIKKTKTFFTYFFIIEFPKQGRATIGHSLRPAFPVRVPMTSAALTMRHPAALRAWPLATAKYGEIAGLFHLVIFKDDIHSRSAFRYCPSPWFPPLSCRCLAPVATLWWKGRHSIGKQSLKCGGYYSPVCTRGNQLNWAG